MINEYDKILRITAIIASVNLKRIHFLSDNFLGAEYDAACNRDTMPPKLKLNEHNANPMIPFKLELSVHPVENSIIEDISASANGFRSVNT